MENSFFIYAQQANVIKIERLHLCSWEFNNNSSLVEFGFEVSKESLHTESLTISLFIPWVESSCETKDLYEKLSIADNSRFIFNDSINESKYLKIIRVVWGSSINLVIETSFVFYLPK